MACPFEAKARKRRSDVEIATASSQTAVYLLGGSFVLIKSAGSTSRASAILYSTSSENGRTMFGAIFIQKEEDTAFFVI